MTVYNTKFSHAPENTGLLPVENRMREQALRGAGSENRMVGPNRPQRISGTATVSFQLRDQKTVLKDLGQSGSAKIKIPKTYDGVPLAVFLNTAGGITGGDHLTYRTTVGDGCNAAVSTQAAERVYRAQHGIGTITNELRIGYDGSCAWLPQETILFENSALRRHFNVHLADRASLLAIESLVLGRKAMGETISTLCFHDSWRIHQNGELVFADETRLTGDIENLLAGYATGDGARAFATLIAAGPGAAEKLDDLRAAMNDQDIDAGASLVNGILVARLIASDGDHLRKSLITTLTRFRGTDMPRVWYC